MNATQLTTEEARMLYRKIQYDLLTKKLHPNIIFLAQINQDKLLIPFDMFHKATEETLKRPVYTHEFANPKKLLLEFYDKLPQLTILTKIEEK